MINDELDFVNTQIKRVCFSVRKRREHAYGRTNFLRERPFLANPDTGQIDTIRGQFTPEIIAKRKENSHITARLNKAFGSKTAVYPGHDHPQNQIRVCSLIAVTGLKSPSVFLMGIHDFYEMEQSIRLSDEGRECTG